MGSSQEDGGGICVVYLAWTPYGFGHAESFLASYRRYRAGAPHRLALALAGPDGDRTPWRQAFAGEADEVIDLGEGMDLDHYRAAVERVVAERYFFLNTVSEVLADDWLAHMERALVRPEVGIVGATGSYESPNAVRPGPLRRLRPGHPPFPNPHLRTNAFGLERELLLSLDWSVGMSRQQTVALEGGNNSLTRQVLERGLEAVVVGRDGVAYPVDRWKESETFRSGDQRNLLIADNRTRHFQGGGRITRWGLAWLAWGGPLNRG